MAKILKVIEANNRDMSINEIARKTGLHRNTVGKYVFALEREGKIRVNRIVGRAKLYSLSDA